MLTVELNMYHGVALGAFLFWLGGMITDKVSLLNRYCIPAPLVGGLCFSILNCILYSAGIASISFDATLQTVFMIMFFTTVGFTVSIPTLLKGGKAVILCLLVSIVMIPLQNFLGGGVMQLFGQDPLLGIGCGSIALIGGPGTAAAFGPDLEAAGAVGGSVVSIAAATFGLVAGSLIGGPTARRLIEKYDLRPAAAVAGSAPGAGLAAEAAGEDESFLTDSPRFIKGFMLLLLAVGVGSQVSVWLKALTGLTFPAYIGAMLVAVVVRNAMDSMQVEYPAEEIDTMGNMFLSIFLAMALAGLKLWELIDLALPMIVCLLLQCVIMFLFTYFVVFNVMGRNYDAAVMTAGFVGFGMGATSNAMANMQVVTRKYGPSPVAYFAIPMVGGMFIDFFNAVFIAANIGWWA
ncbi:sodium/glutamate symporter [Dysosmobacter sp.]|uniref:sodium/glutamate symporter n=1 Tax=Dysosmobacter sp. TaxID=2591382 RepID=UPI002A84CA57|nr:sodium/glutamate symporter [Dysosmobacter sp.]MDY3280856.1 sodium/glutamate symporter [Dysosmobacter sp.]